MDLQAQLYELDRAIQSLNLKMDSLKLMREEQEKYADPKSLEGCLIPFDYLAEFLGKCNAMTIPNEIYNLF